MDLSNALRFQLSVLNSSLDVLAAAAERRPHETSPGDFLTRETPLAIEDARTALEAFGTLADLLEASSGNREATTARLTLPRRDTG